MMRALRETHHNLCLVLPRGRHHVKAGASTRVLKRVSEVSGVQHQFNERLLRRPLAQADWHRRVLAGRAGVDRWVVPEPMQKFSVVQLLHELGAG